MSEVVEIGGEYKLISPALCDERDDNPNRQSKATFQALCASIRACKFVDPIIVRRMGARYEVLGGAHRLRAARVLRMPLIPVMDQGKISDLTARQLLINLNETKGSSDNDALAAVVQRIEEEGGKEALQALPYNDAQLADFLDADDDSGDADEEAEEAPPDTRPAKIRPADIANMFELEGLSQEQYRVIAKVIRKWRRKTPEDVPAWELLVALLHTDRGAR